MLSGLPLIGEFLLDMIKYMLEKTRTTEQEPQIIDTFGNEMINMWEEKGIIYYRKIEPIKGAEKVTKTTTVETRLSDGTVESTNEANPGDWIITG